MSKNRHKGHAQKREAGGFVALPYAVLRSSEFAALSPFAVKAIMDLLAQYRGDNNGDLCAAWKVMAERGWRSRDSLTKGVAELLEHSFIVVTRQGMAGSLSRGGKRVATLYGVTFFEVDWCGGKLDVSAPTRTFMGAWRRPSESDKSTSLRVPAALSVTRRACQSKSDCPAERVKERLAA